jgi:hypothetical protein
MTKTVRAWLVLIGVLLFAVGLLVGQQTQRSKYQKYFRPANLTVMDFATLRTEIDMLEAHSTEHVPSIWWDGLHARFVARVTVTSAELKQPLDELRRSWGLNASFAYEMLKVEVPELTPSEFTMEFVGFPSDDAIKLSVVAKYTNGKIVFR